MRNIIIVFGCVVNVICIVKVMYVLIIHKTRNSERCIPQEYWRVVNISPSKTDKSRSSRIRISFKKYGNNYQKKKF